ncbi:MAG: formyltransferase family protein [Bdellovibrionota bacterium]
MSSEKIATVPRLLKSIPQPARKILFLGYDETQTRLPNILADQNCEVWQTSEKINSLSSYDLIISFGYRHILHQKLIKEAKTPIINLHMSYLPWNRGAHSNFWSFFEGTPSGVSIHFIDEGIDTGPILYQKLVQFNESEKTFSQTYQRLFFEMEKLFIENLDQIIAMEFKPVAQSEKGSFHRTSDLPKEFSGWDSEISKEVLRLRKILDKKT